jgi:hypothetical protein
MTEQQLIGEINQMPLLDKIQMMEWIAKAIQKDVIQQLKVETPSVFQSFLLSAPVMSDEQLSSFENNRKNWDRK